MYELRKEVPKLGVTIAEWEEHFKTLPHERRRELKEAIKTIEKDHVFNKQFAWTGLFALTFSFDAVDPVLFEESMKERS